MKIRCLVIDDNPLAVDLLTAYIRRIPALELVGTATDPVKGLQLLDLLSPQLVFLDVQMPEMTGLEFLNAAGNNCRFILVTAYKDYAIEGFEYGVVDYLLKPVPFERFCKAANRAVALLAPEHSVYSEDADAIFVRTENRLQKVRLADIRYIESMQNYVVLHLLDQKLLSLQPLKRIAEDLPTGNFVQIHRSYIIGIKHVTAVERARIQIEASWLPIGNSYRRAVCDRLQKI